jgi:hypothetical protein
MQRAVVVLCSTVFLQLAVTSPAHAWWDFLEELSGPGWWKGVDIDARLFCLVDNIPPEKKKALVDRMMQINASLPSFKVLAGQAGVPGGQAERTNFVNAVRAETNQWSAKFDDWEAILDEWQGFSGRDIDKIAVLRASVSEARTRANASLVQVVTSVEAWIAEKGTRVAGENAVKQAEQDATKAVASYQRAAESMRRIVDTPRHRAAALPGVIYSACRLHPGERRRAAFDVGMRFFWTNDDRYASGERISLTTVEPAFAWSVFNNTAYDVLDYGLGAGFYWISSKAFPSVSGGFLEPARFDLHFPTNFVKSNTMTRKVIRSLVFRVGYLTFPGGFEPDAFLADPLNPETHRRIGRDWVRYYGIYVDTEVFRKN